MKYLVKLFITILASILFISCLSSRKTTDGKLDSNENRFCPSTNINYSIQRQQYIKIHLYDVSGQLLDTLFSGNCNIGDYSLKPDFQNLKSGVYFYKLISEDTSVVKKFVLVK